MVMLLTGTILLATNYSRNEQKLDNEELTTRALSAAKEALIAYASTFNQIESGGGISREGMMGFLPCPERDTSPSEGQSPVNCFSQYQSFIGRIPWKTLGIEPLKDGSGNCLWYAVSSEYKNGGEGSYDATALPAGSGLSRTDMLNDDSNGSFELFNRNGDLIKGAAADDRPVAIIIAPGKIIPGQVRAFDKTTHCGDDFDAAQFMEVFNTIDNTAITATDDSIDEFITSDLSNDVTFNDRIITISQKEIFDAIKKQSDFSNLMRNTTQALAQCVANFGLGNPNTTTGVACPPQTCKACNKVCQDDFVVCQKASKGAAGDKVCKDLRTICQNNCVAPACGDSPPGCGVLGVNDFRLPWPTPMILADYRDSADYIENATTDHLGRLPIDISTTNVITNNIDGNYLLDYLSCSNIVTDDGAVNLTSQDPLTNSKERRIWQNWKDHFFYALATDYDSSNPNTPAPAAACPNCLTINGAGSYAAIVLFSAERLSGQTRTVLPNDADTKQTISNYLEGSNAVDDSSYQTGAESAIFNDIAYCIEEDMNVVACP